MIKKAAILLMLSALSLADIAAQCPMCKASVESSQATHGKSVGMGLNTGILMLLVAVYIIVFSIGIMWYRNYRRSQQHA